MAEGSVCATAICTLCYAGTLELVDGMLVCDACGNIAAGFTQETQEFQAGVTAARSMRRSTGHSGSQQEQPQAAEEREPPPIGDGIQAYVQALQQLQLRLILALVRELSLSDQVAGIARQIWYSYLARSKALEPAFAEAIERKVQARLETLRNNPMPHAMLTMLKTSATPAVGDELARVLPPSATLSILLLACWHARQTVSPFDIVRLCFSGKLPYLSFAHDNAEILQPYQRAIPRSLVTTHVPSPSKMYNRAVEIANSVAMPCPAINGTLWLQRYVAELNLPSTIFPVACEILKLYCLPYDGCSLQYFAGYPPWAQVMAVLVVAVRMVYGLHGTTVMRSVHSQHMKPPPQWIEWAAKHLAKLGGLSQVPFDASEVTQMNATTMKTYMETLRSTVFAGHDPPEALHEVRDWFNQLAHQLIDLRSPVEVIVPGEGSSTATVLGNEYMVMVGRLSSSAVSSEYAAVLTVCAAYVWSTPQNFHRAVLQLEKDLVESECQLSYTTDVLEQAKYEKLDYEAHRLRTEQRACEEAIDRIRSEIS